MFLKAQNKAGLEKTVWFGPIMSDVTPPECPPTIHPYINGHYLTINWTTDTFRDTEQDEEIGKLMFRIGKKYWLLNVNDFIHYTYSHKSFNYSFHFDILVFGQSAGGQLKENKNWHDPLSKNEFL